MPSRTNQGQSIRSSKSSSSSDYSDDSDRSSSTAPTVSSTRPSIDHYKTNGNPYKKDDRETTPYAHLDFAELGISSKSLTASIPSADDLDEDAPRYDVRAESTEVEPPSALASTPEEFAEYFPSTQEMSIKHDDTTLDGNMNLRIDTQARTIDGGHVDLTLFHLRMHDLRSREFSLRRYCRESGREICHSRRKYAKPSVITRPGLQRSMSSALSSLRSKSENKTATITGLKRHDSGYDSMNEDDLGDEESVAHSPMQKPSSGFPIPTNTTQLEFSNYTHVEVKRRGARNSKRYGFEYWGSQYAWKRVAISSGNFREVSYHLVNTKTAASLAHIVPVALSLSAAREENAKGGWIPPCSMFFEESILESSSNLADVVVASGLIALVDDSIKSRWHQKSRMQMTIPGLIRSSSKAQADLVSPKRLMNEVFHRGKKVDNRPPTPLQAVRP